MPNVGTPFPDSRPTHSGNNPSLAAAKGISPQSIIHPFSAPNPDTTTAKRGWEFKQGETQTLTAAFQVLAALDPGTEADTYNIVLDVDVEG